MELSSSQRTRRSKSLYSTVRMTTNSAGITAVILVTLCHLILPVTSSCLTVHVFGQKTADCKDSNLKSLPNYLPPDIKVLKMNRNDLKILTAQTFQSYQSLQEIFLEGNQISEVHRQAFRGLLNLQHLDLSSNKLKTIPSKAFKDIPYLRILNLKDNPLGSIAGTAFWATPYLEKLNLENCKIKHVSPNSFEGLHKLKELNLVNNRISTLESSAKEFMPPVLNVIRLHQNPWRCDCRLRWLKIWLTENSINWYFGTNVPICQDPAKLEDLSFHSVQPEKFACPAEIQKQNKTKLGVIKSANVTIKCQIYADPVASAKWYFNNGEINTKLSGRKYNISKTGLKNMTYTLSIYNFQVSDVGSYQCFASNNAGSDRMSFDIKLYVPPVTTTVAPTTDTPPPDNALGYASIIGIAVGASLFLLLLGCFICYGLKRRDRKNTYKVRDYKKPQKGKKKKRKNHEQLFEGKSVDHDVKNNDAKGKKGDKTGESKTVKLGNGHATTVIDVDSSTETEPLNPIPPIPPPPKPLRLHQTVREPTPDLIKGDHSNQEKDARLSPYPYGSPNDNYYQDNFGKQNTDKYESKQDRTYTSPMISHPNVPYRKLPNNIPAPPVSARPYLSSTSSRGTNSPVNGRSVSGGRSTPSHSGRNTPTGYSSPVLTSVGLRGQTGNGGNMKPTYDQKENNLNAHTTKPNNRNYNGRDRKSPSPNNPPKIYTEEEPEPVKIISDKSKTEKVNNKKNHSPEPGEKDDLGTAV